MAKVLELQLKHWSFQWIFRVDFLQDWLVWSPCCPRDSQESSPALQFEGINPLTLCLFYGPTLTWHRKSYFFWNLLVNPCLPSPSLPWFACNPRCSLVCRYIFQSCIIVWRFPCASSHDIVFHKDTPQTGLQLHIFTGLFIEVKWSEGAQSCPTLCHPMDCGLPGSSVHGIFQAILLEWIAICSFWQKIKSWQNLIVRLLMLASGEVNVVTKSQPH